MQYGHLAVNRYHEFLNSFHLTQAILVQLDQNTVVGALI